MNKKIIYALPLVTLLTGCSLLKNIFNKNDSNNSGSSLSFESSGVNPSSGNTSSSNSGTTKLSTWVNFEDAGLKDGTQFNSDTVKDQLLSFLNLSDNIYSSFDEDHTKFASVTKDSGTTPATLQIGTGSYGGYFKLNFKYSVTKVSFKVSSYFKWNSSSWNTDPNALVMVNSSSNTFNVGVTSGQSEPPEAQDFSVDFATPVTYIKFYNSDAPQRVFIRGFQVTYLS